MLNKPSPTRDHGPNPLYRKPIPTHVLCLTFVFACTFFLLLPNTNVRGQGIDSEVARFVGEVAIGSEYDHDLQVAMKWTEPAKLSVFGGDAKQTRFVREAVQKINRALSPTNMSVQFGRPDDQSATLKVYFAPLSRFPQIAKRENITYIEGNWGYFFCERNDQFEIESAIVLLASDRLRGDRLKHFALEEITQSLGLPGDSGRYSSSLFYENQAERKFGTATEFSALDKRLLQFLYRRVKPGMHAVEMGILMAEHWIDDQ